MFKTHDFLSFWGPLYTRMHADARGGGKKRRTLFSFPDSVEFAAAVGNAALMHFHSCIRD